MTLVVFLCVSLKMISDSAMKQLKRDLCMSAADLKPNDDENSPKPNGNENSPLVLEQAPRTYVNKYADYHGKKPSEIKTDGAPYYSHEDRVAASVSEWVESGCGLECGMMDGEDSPLVKRIGKKVKKLVNLGAGNIAVKSTHRGVIRRYPNGMYFNTKTRMFKPLGKNSSVRVNPMGRILARMKSAYEKGAYFVNEGEYESVELLTLTYRVSLLPTDFARNKERRRDLERYFDKLRYNYGGGAVSEYIAVYDVSEAGAVHIHLILFQRGKCSLGKSGLKSLWGLGSVDVGSRPEGVQDFLRYILTDPYNEYDEGTDRRKSAESKRVRMLDFPKSFRIVRMSRGIGDPPCSKGFFDPSMLPNGYVVKGAREGCYTAEDGSVVDCSTHLVGPDSDDAGSL
ncbi:hypothetical protein B7993_01070 [Fibrobacter sp. UWH3]|nr:hypothetical protein B7993_01070 [Fibrobacter sp. UWH3]